MDLHYTITYRTLDQRRAHSIAGLLWFLKDSTLSSKIYSVKVFINTGTNTHIVPSYVVIGYCYGQQTR